VTLHLYFFEGGLAQGFNGKLHFTQIQVPESFKPPCNVLNAEENFEENSKIPGLPTQSSQSTGQFGKRSQGYPRLHKLYLLGN
jgi:hypothetical protein